MGIVSPDYVVSPDYAYRIIFDPQNKPLSTNIRHILDIWTLFSMS